MNNKLIQPYSLGDSLTFSEVSPGFPVIKVNNSFATATISLYGGQVLEYKPHAQSEQVIWLSDKAIFKNNKAIRGGIPICWPWFGDYDKNNNDLPTHSHPPAHGFARITHWNIHSTKLLSDGSTEIILQMPCHSNCQEYQAANAHYHLSLEMTLVVSNHLKVSLTTTNNGSRNWLLADALHSYFRVSNINKVTIQGLEQAHYVDKLKKGLTGTQESELWVKEEIDKVFLNTSNEIILNDPGFDRAIFISKENSSSTVIWNPWQKKSSQMLDMPAAAWLNMICIEPANVLENQRLLTPGESHTLSTSIKVKN
ncbi:MAG: D-hexose-6-phosphate mutarotase [Gammaproteobacteria bacterium]|nr:D-hexose-6-phosphate mutarotase [Gammaproteobacteria bacterium]